MQAQCPAWPASLPRVFQPLGSFRHNLSPRQIRDRVALDRARTIRERGPRCSNFTGTWREVLFKNRADFTALGTFTAEASLLGGTNQQPVIPALYFDIAGPGRIVSLLCRGVLSTTSTPTLIFQVRLGATSGSTYLSGTSVGVSPTITCASAVSTQMWELRLDLICNTPGIGSTNCTLSGAGYVMSPGGFAAPYIYALAPTTPPTATWTSTIDDSVTQYVNVSVTCGTSSSSNTVTCKQCILYGEN